MLIRLPSAAQARLQPGCTSGRLGPDCLLLLLMGLEMRGLLLMLL